MAKKRKSYYLFLFCLFLFIGPLLYGKQKLFRINEKAVNFRSGPGTTYKVLGSLKKGDTVELIKKSGSWLEVISRSGAMKGVEGYVHQNVVVAVNAADRTESVQKKKKAEIPKTQFAPAKPQQTEVDSGDEQLIKDIQGKMLSDSLLFLGLLKKMAPKLVKEKKEVTRVAMVKIIRGNTPVLDGFLNGSKVIHYPYINETFVVLEEEDDYFKIELPGKRSGWIQRTAVQFFREASAKPVLKFAGLDKNETAQFVAQLADIYNQIVAGKNVADKIISNYNSSSIRKTPFYRDYEKINKYYRLSSQFYKKYRIDENLTFAGTKADFLAKLKLWGELLLGTEKTGTKYAGESEADKVGGGRHAFNVGGNYQLSDAVDISLDFGTEREVMLETFSQTHLGGGVRFVGANRLQLGLNAGINGYSNPDNERADFSNFSLSTDLLYNLSANAKLTFQYNMQSYKYKNDAPNDYGAHRLFAGLSSALSRSWGLQCNMMFETQSGDLANHKFTHLNPVLTLSARKSRGFFKSRLLLDSYSFSENEQNNFTKVAGDLNWGSGRSDFMLGGFIKSHPENKDSNYTRLMLRYTSNSKDFKKKFSVAIFSSLFANEKANSCSDLNLELSSLGKSVTNSFNLLFKFWHSPGDADLGETVSPHVVDLYWKLGFNMKYLVIGPVIGVHGNLVFSGDEDVVKRDGNLLRIGGFADLDVPVSDRLRILGQGTFEFGNVYTNDYTGFNDLTGEILIDGIYLRHPTTLHINVSAQYQLNSGIYLFARGGFYLVKTGFEPISGMYPVESNSRFYLVGGVNFRLH